MFYKQFQFMPISLFLLIFFFSCSDQNHSNHGSQPEQLSKDSLLSKSRLDTSLQLTFKTGIRAILEDSKGNIWFGSHQEGVAQFDGSKMIYYTEADGLSNRQVRTIYEDDAGIIWMDCGVGISSYDGERITTSTSRNYTARDEWKWSDDDLWFKGNEMSSYNTLEQSFGVYQYDGQTFSFRAFPVKRKEGDDNYYSVTTPFIRSKNQMIWFGTYGAVIGYNGTDFTIIDNEYLGFNKDTGYLHIRSLMEDSKGNLWIGNNGIGILLYDGNSIVNFSDLHALPVDNSLHSIGYESNSGSPKRVFSIGEDLEGNIWFGDRDTGAWRYNGTSLINYGLEDGLTTTHIWQIYNSKKGTLWFAMGDGKVLEFNGKSFDRIF